MTATGSDRRPRVFPVRALVVTAAATAAIVASLRFTIPFVDPPLLAAALFLYTPVLLTRGRPMPTWLAAIRPSRDAVWLTGLLAIGLTVYAAFVALPLPAALKPSMSGTLPPLGPMIFWQATMVALPEEVFFRGWLHDEFESAGWEPVLAVSIVFAIVHFAILPSPFRLLTFFPSILLGLARKKCGSVWVPAILHFSFNFHPYLFARQW